MIQESWIFNSVKLGRSWPKMRRIMHIIYQKHLGLVLKCFFICLFMKHRLCFWFYKHISSKKILVNLKMLRPLKGSLKMNGKSSLLMQADFMETWETTTLLEAKNLFLIWNLKHLRIFFYQIHFIKMMMHFTKRWLMSCTHR